MLPGERPPPLAELRDRLTYSRTRSRTRENPSSLLPLTGLALAVAAGYALYASGAFDAFWETLNRPLSGPGSTTRGSAGQPLPDHTPTQQRDKTTGQVTAVPRDHPTAGSGGASGGGSGPPQTSSHPSAQASAPPAPRCLRFDPTTTYLEFALDPWQPSGSVDPATGLGPLIIYYGLLSDLTYPDPVTGQGRPVAGATVEFYDADHCDAGPYMWTVTDAGGRYRCDRPVHPDEREGYRCYALFNTGADYNGAVSGHAPASTGTVELQRLLPPQVDAGVHGL